MSDKFFNALQNASDKMSGSIKSSNDFNINLVVINDSRSKLINHAKAISSIRNISESMSNDMCVPIVISTYKVSAVDTLGNELYSLMYNSRDVLHGYLQILYNAYEKFVKPVKDIYKKSLDTEFIKYLEHVWDGSGELQNYIFSILFHTVMGSLDSYLAFDYDDANIISDIIEVSENVKRLATNITYYCQDDINIESEATHELFKYTKELFKLVNDFDCSIMGNLEKDTYTVKVIKYELYIMVSNMLSCIEDCYKKYNKK